MSSSTPTISVIIPTYHRLGDLEKCLSCLAPDTQTLAAEHYEVIVSDDGRNPSAEDLIKSKFPWAQWAAGPQNGPAENRNNGASLARGSLLVFTDDDCLPSANWLEVFHNNRETAEVLEGLTRADQAQYSHAVESPRNLKGGYLWSCNFAIQKTAFEALEGFDTGFPAPAMEDCDLRERIKKADLSWEFIKEAEVVHPWRPAKTWKFWEIHLKAIQYYRSKHPEVDSAPLAPVFFKEGLRKLKQSLLDTRKTAGFRGFSHILIYFCWCQWTAFRFLLNPSFRK